jgi:hypothetical protein
LLVIKGGEFILDVLVLRLEGEEMGFKGLITVAARPFMGSPEFIRIL